MKWIDVIPHLINGEWIETTRIEQEHYIHMPFNFQTGMYEMNIVVYTNGQKEEVKNINIMPVYDDEDFYIQSKSESIMIKDSMNK